MATTYVVATDGVHTSAALCDYLDSRVTADDTVHAVNSLRDDDTVGSDAVRDGEDALTAVPARLGAVATVETHQFVRGNEPAEDVLDLVETVEADELVFGMCSTTTTVDCDSVARSLLTNASVPMAVVPLEEA